MGWGLMTTIATSCEEALKAVEDRWPQWEGTTDQDFKRPNPCIQPKAVMPSHISTTEEELPEDLRRALWGEDTATAKPEVVFAGTHYREIKDGAGPSSPGHFRRHDRASTPLAKLGKDLFQNDPEEQIGRGAASTEEATAHIAFSQ